MTRSLPPPWRAEKFSGGYVVRDAKIKVGRLSRDSGRYLVGPVQLREQLEMGNITSRPQEFAGGFVDFLLGRGARHPR
jgi:hypothetical protein